MERGNGIYGIPKESEVDKICEGECGTVCETIGTPSMLRFIRRVVVLTRMLSTLDLSWE